MTFNRIIKKQLTTLSCLCLLAGVLFMTSCQKDQLTEQVDENIMDPPIEVPHLALEKFILDFNFRVPTERLTDEQVLEYYNQSILTLAEEDRNLLIAAAEQALEQMYASPDLEANINPRASESVLTVGVPGDEFGQGVTISGSRVFVGAPGDQKVYEYQKKGGTYTMVDEISPDGVSGDFGYAVSVFGSWMVVGAPNFGPPFGQAGRAFLFQKQNGAWVQKATLDGPAGNTNFGESVVLRAKQLAILSRNPGAAIQTTVSVYRGNGLGWTLTDELSEPGYGFFSIDMNTQGSQIVGTGSYFNSVASVRAGVFTKERRSWDSSDSWSFSAAVVNVSGPPSFFPRDIAIDNNTIVISTFFPGTDHFVLTPSAGGWTTSAKLTIPPSPPANRWVDVDGNKIVVGVDGFISNAVPEQVHVFEGSGTSWQLTETLTPSDGGINVRMWDLVLDNGFIVAGLPGIFGAPGKAIVFK